MNFSKQFKDLRTSMGITQKELGSILGISRRDVSNIELGSRNIGPKTVEKIMEGIIKVNELSYLASQFDTNAWMSIQKGKNSGCAESYYRPWLYMGFDSKEKAEKMKKSFGGTIYTGYYYKRRLFSCFNINCSFFYHLSGKRLTDLLERIKPFLRVKREMAETLINCRRISENIKGKEVRVVNGIKTSKDPSKQKQLENLRTRSQEILKELGKDYYHTKIEKNTLKKDLNKKKEEEII